MGAYTVTLPDGNTADFPDTMSPEDIKEVLKSKFGGEQAPAAPTKPEESSVTDDVLGGVKHSLLKTSRGIATTFLPRAAEKWAEDRHLMPTAETVQTAKDKMEGSTAGLLANLGTDVLQEFLPAKRVMGGAKLLKDSVQRAMALGGTLGGVRAEPGETGKDAVLGAAGGLAGELGGQALGRTLGAMVKPSAEAKALMARGIVPTLGEGVDQSRASGKLLNFLESQAETMPLTGMTFRGNKQAVANKLLDEAATLATPGSQALPHGSNEDVIAQLLRNNKQDLGDALRNTTVRVPSNLHSDTNTLIDQLAVKHGVSDATADAIKVDLNKVLWAGVRDGKMPASSLENIKEDMFAGLPSARNNSNAQQLLGELGGSIKNWVNRSALQSGYDLPSIRQALVNANVLKRAGVTDKGLSGPRLGQAVRANDSALGVADTASREMQDLAEVARGVTVPRSPFGSRNAGQLMRDFTGGAAEAGLMGLTSGLGNAGIISYGLLNKSPAVRKLLMGDPATRAAFLKALSPAAVTAGIESYKE